MNLDLPTYNLKHTRPVIGYGQFSTEAPAKDAVCMVDDTIVNQKFKLWDYVMKNDLLTSKDLNLRYKAILLLKDKSIMAYAHLKFDNEPIKTYGLQDCLLSDPFDRNLFNGSNQTIGKSFCLNVDAATEFMLDHGHNWIGILVSGSLPQSQYQMDRIKQLLKSSKITYREEDVIDTRTGKKDNTTQLSYTFYADDRKTPLYRNLLICCPHTSSALGYPVNNLWLDEFDFWENCDQRHFMFQIAIPRTFRTEGKIKVYTNPNGRERMMHELWNQKTADGKPAWHRYHFNYWDGQGATQDGFNKRIVGMTRTRIESTLLAVFTRTEGSFFSQQEIKDMHCPELAQKGDSAGYGRDTAWFLDVGAVHDQCVLIGGYLEENTAVPDIPLMKVFYVHKYPLQYPLGRVVGIEQVKTDDGWADYVTDNPSIKTVLADYATEFAGKKYQPLFGFDATGNAGMLPLFQAAGIDGVDVIFSGKSKWHMYQRYQYYVQQRFLKRANERDGNTIRGCTFDYQASKLVIKKDTHTVYKQIHHENEDDLDDTQDAMVGFIHLIENPDLPSLSFDIIDKDGKSIVDKDGNIKDDVDDQLKGQYVPSYVNQGELRNWMRDRGELK